MRTEEKKTEEVEVKEAEVLTKTEEVTKKRGAVTAKTLGALKEMVMRIEDSELLDEENKKMLKIIAERVKNKWIEVNM